MKTKTKKLSAVQQSLLIARLQNERADALDKAKMFRDAAAGIARDYIQAGAILKALVDEKKAADADMVCPPAATAAWSAAFDYVREYEKSVSLIQSVVKG